MFFLHNTAYFVLVHGRPKSNANITNNYVGLVPVNCAWNRVIAIVKYFRCNLTACIATDDSEE